MDRDITDEINTGWPRPETSTTFYTALARGLISWQLVERGVLEVLHVAVHATRPGALYAAFHATQHTATQIKMADAAVQFWCDCFPGASDSVREKWVGRSGLRKRADECTKTRNGLAHLSVYIEPQKKLVHEKIYLSPAMTDTRFPFHKPRTRYTVTEINHAEKRFRTLALDLIKFARDMVQLEEHKAQVLQSDS